MTSVDQICEYMRYTPQNSNVNVLRSLANNLSGGGPDENVITVDVAGLHSGGGVGPLGKLCGYEGKSVAHAVATFQLNLSNVNPAKLTVNLNNGEFGPNGVYFSVKNDDGEWVTQPLLYKDDESPVNPTDILGARGIYALNLRGLD